MQELMAFIEGLPPGTAVVHLPKHVYQRIEYAACRSPEMYEEAHGMRIRGVLLLPLPRRKGAKGV